MRGKRRLLNLLCLLCALLMLTMTFSAFAEGLSDDNSLSSLGIQTDGVTVSPEFSFDIWNYDVTVPAGTTELSISPELSNSTATINSVSGTTLNEDGTGRVVITVTAENGSVIEYALNITPEAGEAEEENSAPAEEAAAEEAAVPAVEAQPETAAAPQVAETAAPQVESAPPQVAEEPQTEDSRFVKVDKNSLEEAEKTIERLQQEMEVYKERIHLFTYVIYGLIGLSVVLLFLVINLILRRKDIARELSQYKKMGYDPAAMSSGMDQRGGHDVPEEMWLDDDDEWTEEPEGNKKGKAKKKKGDVPGQQFGEPYLEEARNPQSSWTETQIGTPVQFQGTGRAERSPRYEEQTVPLKSQDRVIRDKEQDLKTEQKDAGAAEGEKSSPMKKIGDLLPFGKKGDASSREEGTSKKGSERAFRRGDAPGTGQDQDATGSSKGVKGDTKLYSVREKDAGSTSVPTGNTRVINLPGEAKDASSPGSGNKEPASGTSVEIDMIDL